MLQKIYKLNGVLILVLIMGLQWSSTIHAQIVNRAITHDGVVREYTVFLPNGYDGSEALPLVLDLHGLGSDNGQQAFYSAMIGIADTANFLVAHPQGLPIDANDPTSSNHWNANFGTGVDDLGFLDKMIDHIYTDYNVDLARVYSMGMSNGGFMSYTLACELSDRIAAVASVTGSMVFDQINSCEPGRPIPVMQIHGTNDGVVAFDGDTDAPTIPDMVDFWVNFNNCSETPTITDVPDVDETDNSTAMLEVYGDCDPESEVQFYIIADGGHTWPGAFPLPALGSTNQDFSASIVIWDFFNRFIHPDPRPGSVVSSQNEILNQELLQVFPNPTKDQIYIQSTDLQIDQIEIWDGQGRLLQNIEWENTNGVISTQLIPNGIYYLKVITETGVFNQQIIVTK